MASEDNQLQLESFLRFSKLKREQHVKEILSTIEEFEGYRVQDGVCDRHGMPFVPLPKASPVACTAQEMYSTAEVHALLQDLAAELKLMVFKVHIPPVMKRAC
jgi:hypothetical protein